MTGLVKSTTPDRKGLLPVSLMPSGMDSLNRNNWLVDNPVPGEGECQNISVGENSNLT